MIITKTPFRLSLLGGGTDYSEWFHHHGGLVVGGTINKYIYITSRFLPPFFGYKTRLSYHKIEEVKSNNDIQHRAINKIIKTQYYDERGLEINHMADLPGRSGIGSSSSFVVGMIHNLWELQNLEYNKKMLSEIAMDIEQVALEETVGYQDVTWAANGGFNYIEFCKDGEIIIKPIDVSRQWLEELESHLLLLYTGITRTASKVAASYVPTITEKYLQQKIIHQLALDGIESIYKQDTIEIGRLLHKNWVCKKQLSNKVSSGTIDYIYDKALANGAIGGKITGAGGGGFMVLLAPPEKQQKILASLPQLVNIPFKFDFEGSKVIFNNE